MHTLHPPTAQSVSHPPIFSINPPSPPATRVGCETLLLPCTASRFGIAAPSVEYARAFLSRRGSALSSTGLPSCETSARHSFHRSMLSHLETLMRTLPSVLSSPPLYRLHIPVFALQA